jgi:hypothetical protein
MSAHLSEVRDLFFSPPQKGMKELVNWAKLNSRDPVEMLTMSYNTMQVPKHKTC